MTERGLALPAAIVVAGALIGAGLFLGLRERGGAPPAAPPSPGPTALAAAAPPLAQLVEQARLGLEAQRAVLTGKCWAPAVQAQPAPPSIHFVFDFTFDAQGHQVMRGVIEDRRTARAGVTRCVTESLAPIAIPPPAVAVRVEVPFDLP